MSCCDEGTARVPNAEVSRRSMFKGAALIASVLPAVHPTPSQGQGKPLKQVKIAYCSQLLCGVPYEVARSATGWASLIGETGTGVKRSPQSSITGSGPSVSRRSAPTPTRRTRRRKRSCGIAA